MGSISMSGQALRATLCEIERGLFQIRYYIGTVEWDATDLPHYQIGTSETDAERRIEQKAREFGFESILWDYELAIPPVVFHQSLAVPDAHQLKHDTVRATPRLKRRYGSVAHPGSS